MIILDKYNNVGPLAGIHSAISFCIDNIKIKEGLVVTVPVDTPFIPYDLISRFENEIERSKSKSEFDFFIVTSILINTMRDGRRYFSAPVNTLELHLIKRLIK